MAAAAGLRLRGPLVLRCGPWRSFTSRTDGEARVTRVLREKFPRASVIRVVDISGNPPAPLRPPRRAVRSAAAGLSPARPRRWLGASWPGGRRQRSAGGRTAGLRFLAGGCGAMYEVHVESEEFREKQMVQQHQMVNQALCEEIKSMHGLRIFTSTPKP
ncbi:BolA-like protein 3 [Aix galericulata]|nr:BolA-like protein 3 [Aix galericulata]